MVDKTVDSYIAGLGGWKGEIVARIRKIVLEAAPKANMLVALT